MNGSQVGSSRVFSRRSIIKTGALLGTVGWAAACANPDEAGSRRGTSGGGSKQLLVADGGGAWGAAQRKAFFEPFQKATGITVIPVPTEGQPQLRSAILSGKPGRDVVDVGGGNVAAWEQEGLLQKIDFAGWKNPTFKSQFQPYKATDFRVPSIIFAVQVAFDQTVTKGPLQGWADLWDTGRFPGKRSLHVGDAPGGGTYEIALLADGVKPDALYPLDLERALRKLSELRPHILKFWETGAESVQLLIDKQISAVAAWNGRVQTAVEQGAKNVQSSWEQALLQVDYWAIPKGARNVRAAQQFIEFVVQPEQQAEFAKLITYAPTLPQAYKYIPEERRKLLATAPEYKDKIVLFDPDFWATKNANGKLMPEVASDLWQKWLTS